MHLCKRQMAAALVSILLAIGGVSAQTYPPTVSVPTAAPAAQLPVASLSVPEFSSVDVCLPVNVLVVPTSSPNYTVTAGAEQGVLQALSAYVQAGVLYLQSYGRYSTSNIVTLQVGQTGPSSLVLTARKHYKVFLISLASFNASC